MTPSAFHTHCTFCDGKNTPEEMVLEAIKLGCGEIGFSSHSFMTHESRWGMPPDVEEKYKAEISRLKDKYSDRIKIFLGIEYDWTSDIDTTDYDYVIGAVHYVLKNGHFIPVDETADHHKNAIKELYNGDADALAEDYYKMTAQLHDKTGCDIIAHFDIITKFDERDKVYEETPRYCEAALSACRSLAKKPVVFEINTGAISRGYRTTPYPAPFILNELVRLKAPLVITPDTHSKDTLIFGMKDVERALDKINCAYLTEMEQILEITRKK